MQTFRSPNSRQRAARSFCARRAAAVGLAAIAFFAACTSARTGASRTFAPIHAVAARSIPGLHVSLVWESGENDFLSRLRSALDGAPAREAWTRWSSKDARHVVLQSSSTLELELETPIDGLEAALELAAAATQRASAPDASESAPPQDESDSASAWPRRAALALSDADALEPKWRWHASALSAREDIERVDRALSKLEEQVAKFTKATPSAPAPRSPSVANFVLIESSSSSPSEMRWIPAVELDPASTPESRARSCVQSADLAQSLTGWTFVPASVDSFGRREPAYLYTAGDVSTAQKRFSDLNSALNQIGPKPTEQAGSALAARARLAALARAQLSQGHFLLRAMHGNTLAQFESEAAALERLEEASLAQAPDPKGSRWTVVGPPEAWLAFLSTLGQVETLRPPASTRQDTAAEGELKRMWDALGGTARWTALKTLRTLSRLRAGENESAQGIEQWIDFEANRFALAQAIGVNETVVVATAGEAWTIDGAAGVDLSPSQAHKLRARQERTLFALLRRLAQQGRGGINAARANARLEFTEMGRALCWLELNAAGLPARLGYRLDENGEESIYEFADWKLEGALPYPARTLQVDRSATVELDHVEPNAKLDESLWSRKVR